MAYKPVQDLSPDTTIAIGGTNRKTGKKNPDQVEGYYLGSRKVESKKAKSGFCYIHVFQTAKGSVGVWGKTDLDRKVLSIAPGTMTLAKFERMLPTPNGDMYKFSVAVDADNTIEVSAATETTDNGESDGDYSDTGTTDDEGTVSYSNGADEDDEDAAQAMELAAAERQANKAKVEALLRNGKSKTK